MKPLLEIKNLQVSIEEKEILKGVDLDIEEHKVHALMGQNGCGKSTLANTLMGHPFYTVTSGKASMNNEDILKLPTNERSLKGLFLSFQYPSEIPGVTVASFLRMIYNKKNNSTVSAAAFRKILGEKMRILNMKEDFMTRYLNDGFSGGEKKRMEMLQMLVIEPKLAILDEVDSGLDIDALKVVAKAVNYLKEKTGMTTLIITHYNRILKYIEPDVVYIMSDGKITSQGDKNLAFEIEESGYEKRLQA